MTARSAMFNGVALVLLASHISLSAGQAQSDNGGTTASFEVASVKPHKGESTGGGPSQQPNGGYRVTNVALKSIIANAFEVRIFQIEGDPSWITTERFDINARGRPGTPDRLRPAMLRTLLTERFNLVAHFETREQQVYALVLLRSDGRLGPRLKPAAPGSKPGLPLPSFENGVGTIAGESVLMDDFARALANDSRQIVINRTGLNGRFELDLQYTPDSSTVAAPEFPSVFTAVQEQLGLKLQSERAAVPVLVIDSVQRPTPG